MTSTGIDRWRDRLAAAAGRRPRWPPPPRVEPPPPSPSGWETGPPYFVGIGAPRCSTTRWFKLIRQHPEVAVADGARKETQFLSQFAVTPPPAGSAEQYYSYFPRPPGGVAGEWSPDYMLHYWAPALLHRWAPEARLLVLVRDPVERYLSAMAYHRARGAPDHHLVAADAFASGLYAAHLRRWRAMMPARQLLVLQSEACVEDAAGQLRRTYDFLGVDPSFTPPDLDAVVHRGRGEKPPIDEGRRAALVAAYAPDVTELAAEYDGVDVGHWRNFAALT